MNYRSLLIQVTEQRENMSNIQLRNKNIYPINNQYRHMTTEAQGE